MQHAIHTLDLNLQLDFNARASATSLDPQLKALLLEADPDWHRLSRYLPSSQLFVILDAQQQYIAQLCLAQLNHAEMEIKNIAVAAAHRGQGLAKQLIAHAIALARQQLQQCLWVKTGNSSLDQLALYQKMGFRLDHIEKDVFLHYPEPIFENGIACLDQVVLRLAL